MTVCSLYTFWHLHVAPHTHVRVLKKMKLFFCKFQLIFWNIVAMLQPIQQGTIKPKNPLLHLIFCSLYKFNSIVTFFFFSIWMNTEKVYYCMWVLIEFEQLMHAFKSICACVFFFFTWNKGIIYGNYFRTHVSCADYQWKRLMIFEEPNRTVHIKLVML